MIERLIVPGTKRDYALLIKVGQDGSVFGYQNKYLNLAHKIHDKYGFTVVCSPNPDGATNQIADDISFINTLFKVQDSIKIDESPKILFMGMSKGASLGCIEGNKNPQIARLLLLNPPMMINLPQICHAAKTFSGEMMTIVFGSEDPSVKESELLKLHERENLKVVIVPGQDHNFSKDGFNLMTLVEKYLLYNLEL